MPVNKTLQNRFPKIPAHTDDQGWQFRPPEFQLISCMISGSTMNAACDVDGRNAFCVQFCSASDSFLQKDLTGQRVWANFPFEHLERFLLRYFAQKEKDPSIMGCFVVPVWKKASWWPLVEGLQTIAYYPAGTELFTAPAKDGSRRSFGPTRWAVEVKYDPTDRIPAGLMAPCVASPVDSRPDQQAGRATGGSVVWDGAAESRPCNAPAFWRLAVKGSGASRPPTGGGMCSRSPPKSCLAPLPRLLHVKGRAGGGTATVFLDSGAQLNLVSREFARKHAFRVEPSDFQVGFPDVTPHSMEWFGRFP